MTPATRAGGADGAIPKGSDRTQVTLLPGCLDDYIAEDNPVRVVDAFVGELNLKVLGFLPEYPFATAWQSGTSVFRPN